MSAYRASGALCLILIDYVRPLPEVAWLDAGFDQDAFLVAGRREPRTGGVIVARGTRAAVERVAATDPFVTSGVATATVVPFNASFAAGAIREWLQ